MDENIFDDLRAHLESKTVSAGRNGATQEKDSVDAEENMLAQLQRLQFFRTHIFPSMRDFLQTVISLQREKIRAADMDRVVTLQFPVVNPPDTRYGFPLPLEKPQSPQIGIEQLLMTVSPVGKPARHFMVTFRAKALESLYEVDAVVYDELGRRGRSIEGDSILLDSVSEFKVGEFLLATQKLLHHIVKQCINNLL